MIPVAEKPSKDIPLFSSSKLLLQYLDFRKLNHYIDMLEEANRRINLVSRETYRDDFYRFTADSLVPLAFGHSLSGRFFDIGSGGGFPAIPLLLASPALFGTMGERTQKKARFLESVIASLQINADVIPLDFTEAVRTFDGPPFSFGSMKYVRLDSRIMADVKRLLVSGGKFFYFSRIDQSFPREITSIPHETLEYYLDGTDVVRTLSVFSFGTA